MTELKSLTLEFPPLSFIIKEKAKFQMDDNANTYLPHKGLLTDPSTFCTCELQVRKTSVRAKPTRKVVNWSWHHRMELLFYRGNTGVKVNIHF